ncbi:hypothetical protein DNU06_05380 [Putridiphycobacter roseus]|uniref:Secretion system C-terminal sorting domain-containing protein n=1 Tax=Putridiphycobacter roseus TaxID=2219161 RepID=A0A2W1N4Q5_9FLAO|nr:T9SS type A sorting domain-containing protein [Putridiphycobacter roseus]PZE18051.1 hypothetical protein DNU06_05380 [Putridiphycobacter roseus]
MLKQILLSTLFLIPFIGWNQTTVYGVDLNSPILNVINTNTLVATTTSLTSATGTIGGCNGMASDPCGLDYVVYKVASNRYLGNIDLTTGVVTEIGLFTDNISSIAYDYINGVMYGVTGDGANNPEELYSINLTTAAMTYVMSLGNGNDGEAITFNPVDQLLYHWSGWGLGNVVMETIHPTSMVITPVTLSGDDIYNVGAAVYAGNKFLVSDINEQTLHWVTTAGAVTNTGSIYEIKGLSYGGSSLPTVSIVDNDGTVICDGMAIDLTANSNGPNGSFEWFDGSGVSTGITTATVSVDTAGTLKVEYTDLCGVVAIDSITLTIGTSPVVQFSTASPIGICPGDSILISTTTSGTNQWYLNGSAMPGATNDSVYADVAGIYNMLLTNNDGCADSAATGFSVTLNSVPNVTLSPAGGAVFCPGDSVEINVNTGGGNIQWYANGVLIPNANSNSFFATAAGVYNVIKTNTSGCTDSSNVALVITQSALPNVVLTPSPTVNFCGPTTADIMVNAGGGSIQWYKNGVAIVGETSSTYSVASEGTYNVLKTNTNGCSDSSAIATVAVDTCLLGVEGVELDLSVNIYPNPATNQVIVAFPTEWIGKGTSISLFGMDGKKVIEINKESVLTNTIEVDLTLLSPGMYVFRMVTENQEVLKELIVK